MTLPMHFYHIRGSYSNKEGDVTIQISLNGLELSYSIFSNFLESIFKNALLRNKGNKYGVVSISEIIKEIFENNPVMLKFYKDYDNIVKKDFDFFCKRHLKSYDCEVDLKIKFIEGIHQYHDNIYCKSLAYYFSSLQKRKIKMSKIMLNMIKKGRKINKKSYLRALLTQQNLTKKFEQLMKNYDFLIQSKLRNFAHRFLAFHHIHHRAN